MKSGEVKKSILILVFPYEACVCRLGVTRKPTLIISSRYAYVKRESGTFLALYCVEHLYKKTIFRRSHSDVCAAQTRERHAHLSARSAANHSFHTSTSPQHHSPARRGNHQGHPFGSAMVQSQLRVRSRRCRHPLLGQSRLPGRLHTRSPTAPQS